MMSDYQPKVGDRVKVEFEGEVKRLGTHLLALDGYGWVDKEHCTFLPPARPEPRFKVGQVVRHSTWCEGVWSPVSKVSWSDEWGCWKYDTQYSKYCHEANLTLWEGE